MKLKKFIAILSVATMTAGLAVGCGSSDSASSDDKSSKSESDWDSSNDITIVSREDGSGTRGAFIELFGIEEKKDGEKVDMTTDDAQITNSTSVMLTTVAGDDYAIGYVSLGSLNDTVKALKIDGEEATEQNIKDGKYKICRPFNIATKKGADNEVAKDYRLYHEQRRTAGDFRQRIYRRRFSRSLCGKQAIRKSSCRRILFRITGYGKTD